MALIAFHFFGHPVHAIIHTTCIETKNALSEKFNSTLPTCKHFDVGLEHHNVSLNDIDIFALNSSVDHNLTNTGVSFDINVNFSFIGLTPNVSIYSFLGCEGTGFWQTVNHCYRKIDYINGSSPIFWFLDFSFIDSYYEKDYATAGAIPLTLICNSYDNCSISNQFQIYVDGNLLSVENPEYFVNVVIYTFDAHDWPNVDSNVTYANVWLRCNEWEYSNGTEFTIPTTIATTTKKLTSPNGAINLNLEKRTQMFIVTCVLSFMKLY
uniref:Uncharacterized protein n=1 Tax=Acrobeloides nanus TaxID=290746 RepID=A0A914BXD0_9BILA